MPKWILASNKQTERGENSNLRPSSMAEVNENGTWKSAYLNEAEQFTFCILLIGRIWTRMKLACCCHLPHSFTWFCHHPTQCFEIEATLERLEISICCYRSGVAFMRGGGFDPQLDLWPWIREATDNSTARWVAEQPLMLVEATELCKALTGEPLIELSQLGNRALDFPPCLLMYGWAKPKVGS